VLNVACVCPLVQMNANGRDEDLKKSRARAEHRRDPTAGVALMFARRLTEAAFRIENAGFEYIRF
jgi:hypothetical protein